MVAAAHRGHSHNPCPAVSPSHSASAQLTCWNRASLVRLSASPQRVWLVPGSQACTSPDGWRTPSSSTHWLDAATDGVVLIPAVYPPVGR